MADRVMLNAVAAITTDCLQEGRSVLSCPNSRDSQCARPQTAYTRVSLYKGNALFCCSGRERPEKCLLRLKDHTVRGRSGTYSMTFLPSVL